MSDPIPPRKIVAHNVVPLRAEPTNDAELVSQTLMGRTVQVLETRDAWTYVETDDTYRGWLESRWLTDLSDAPLTPLGVLFADMRAEPSTSAPLIVRLPVLAAVFVDPTRRTVSGWVACALPDGTPGWLPQPAFQSLTGAALPLEKLPARRRTAPADQALARGERIGALAAGCAREFLGTPYLWGGSSAFGLDCSGLVQLCYRIVGVTLRRDAGIQRDDPRFVPVETEGSPPGAGLAPGDLVFFGKPGRITHVGIHLEGDTFVHSAGGAGVILTHWGEERYSSSFVDARRLDPARAAEPVTRP